MIKFLGCILYFIENDATFCEKSLSVTLEALYTKGQVLVVTGLEPKPRARFVLPKFQAHHMLFNSQKSQLRLCTDFQTNDNSTTIDNNSSKLTLFLKFKFNPKIVLIRL